MGNGFTCFSAQRTTLTKKPTKRSSSPFDFSPALSDFSAGKTVSVPLPSSSSSISEKKKTKNNGDHSLVIDEQALAAAIILAEQRRRNSLQFNRSASVAYPSAKKQRFPRSSSTNQRSVSDPAIPPRRVLHQDGKMEELESKHFVLVHGGGYGAWCWYKTMTLLEECGYKVDAVDLAGSGVHSGDSGAITSLAQYVDPLIHLLQKLNDEDKVILVGHDLGGACISYAMEMFPSKISKAIFIAAAMPSNGQTTLQLFSKQTEKNDLLQNAQAFVHANGNDRPPTAITLDRAFLKDLLFGRSPAKDVALATVSMRPIPFPPLMEKLCLSEEKYGCVKRFYVGTDEDSAISASTQEAMIDSNPPRKLFWLKNSDHSPFFSRPQALHKILVEISQI